MNVKQLAAAKAVEYVSNNMVVGLGTGSTAYWAIKRIGERVKDGLQVKAVCSSQHTEALATESGIPLIGFNEVDAIDIYIDGADEVDEDHNLIKGGGGALLREKILAYNSRQFIVIVDESKLVKTIGQFPLPVEILPFAHELTIKHLQGLGCQVKLRYKDEKVFTTDNNHYIADCSFGSINNAQNLNTTIQLIPGVIECGIFLSPMVSKVVVGYSNGNVSVL